MGHLMVIKLNLMTLLRGEGCNTDASSTSRGSIWLAFYLSGERERMCNKSSIIGSLPGLGPLSKETKWKNGNFLWRGRGSKFEMILFFLSLFSFAHFVVLHHWPFWSLKKLDKKIKIFHSQHWSVILIMVCKWSLFFFLLFLQRPQIIASTTRQ